MPRKEILNTEIISSEEEGIIHIPSMEHVAQWSEPRGPGAQGSIPGMSGSESAITRGKTQMMLLPPIKFS